MQAAITGGTERNPGGAVPLLVLLTLPFLLVGIGLGWLWEYRTQENRTLQEQRLRGLLTSWAAESAPEAFFRRLLQRVEKELRRPGVSFAKRKAVLRSLHRRFPGLFTFTVLDSHGIPMAELCDRPQPKVAWQRLERAYRKLLAGDPKPLRQMPASVRSLLGGFVPVGHPLSGTLLRADQERSRRWLFAGVPGAGGWLLAHLAAVNEWFVLPLQDRVRRWNRRQSDTRCFLLEGAEPISDDPGLASAPLRELWESLEPIAWTGDTLWGMCRVGPRLTLVASRKNDLPRALRREGIAVLFGLILLWGTCMAAGAHQHLRQVVGETPIRHRLILAVGFAAALPFATIAVITHVFVREHGLKLEGDLYFRMEGALRDLDDLAPALTKRQNDLLIRASNSLSWPTGRPDIWEKHLGRLRAIAPWDSARIFGPGGRSLLTSASHSTIIWSPEDLGFFEQSSRHYLRRLGVNDPRAQASEKARDLSFIENTVANIADNAGSPTEYTAGEERLILVHIPLLDDGRINSLLLILWNRWRLERDFLRKHLLRFARDLPDTRLLVWRPDAPQRWFPRQSPFWMPLRTLFPAIRDQTGCFQGQIRVGRDSYLVTSIRSEAFPGSFLLSVTSNQSIRTELNLAITRVAGVGLLLAFGSAFAALIFARSFLHPITLLGQGIAALKAREFSIRLPQGGKDELGQLIGAFNHMAEGLAELEVAHGIQETLFPSAPLALSPFSIRGGTTSQRTFGGQGFDYGVLENGEAWFLAAACRAPGVTAGLALALAKGVLSHPRTASDPLEAVLDLEGTITPILGEGVALDILYGRLDQHAGTIRWAGTGVCPPLIRAAGKTRIDASPVTRLGSRHTGGTLAFPPGSALLALVGGPSAGMGDAVQESGQWAMVAEKWSEQRENPVEAVAEAIRECLEAEPRTGWAFLLIDDLHRNGGEK